MENTTAKTNGRGDSAALPMLQSLLNEFLNYGSTPRKRNPSFRREVIAVMADGRTTKLKKYGHSGYPLPNGYCFTSHLSSAKQSWIDAGATIKTVRA
jgi:hypothetical protein